MKDDKRIEEPTQLIMEAKKKFRHKNNRCLRGRGRGRGKKSRKGSIYVEKER